MNWKKKQKKQKKNIVKLLKNIKMPKIFMDIINYAREQIENVSFSSDIIVGFPGETFEEYLYTEKLVFYLNNVNN